MRPKYYLFKIACMGMILIMLNSCRTKEPYWETSTKIELKNSGLIWAPIYIKGITYSTLIDTGAESSFPVNFLSDYFSDTTQFVTSGKVVNVLQWKPYEKQKVPPILFRLGDKELKHDFKRHLRYDTCIMIGIDLIKKNSWNFNLRDSILTVSNRALEVTGIAGDHCFKSLIKHGFINKATARLSISLGDGEKVFKERFVFDTGCAIGHIEGSKTHLMDVAIVVNNMERFYTSYPTFFNSLKTHVIPIEKTYPYRTDLFLLDSVIFNGARYTNFRVAIVERPNAADFSKVFVFLGMGFYNRFTNLYIDKKQVVLYNEE